MGHIEVPQPGASQILGRLLTEALREHPDVQWLGLMSEDGFAIAAEGVTGVDDDAVAAGAVRMMVQVRAMSKALGQAGTSQLFLEGSDSGICVIDKDPWVLVMVGAPGVPIGLLRYEAREIAEAFPMGRQAQLSSASEPEDGQEAGADLGDVESQWWADDLGAQPEPVQEPEPEIRWADEPTSEVPSGEAGQQVPVTDFGEWGLAAAEEGTGTAEQSEERPVEIEFPMDVAAVPAGFALDDLEPAADSEVPQSPAPADLAWDLRDLAPPSGPAIELPPPSGPVFELPPPE